MNDLLERLSGGNLLSDGDSKNVAREVLRNPRLFPQLADGLSETDAVVRARTTDALEFVSRSRPDLPQELLPQLMQLGLSDPVDMVRWHCAMIFANLNYDEPDLQEMLPTLYKMLTDESNMVKPWAISSLAILGTRYPHAKAEIVARIGLLIDHPRPSVANRAKKALAALVDESPLPKGWLKIGD
jgi:HEAT repeat protein